ncbi:TPA: hypothetical protein EYN98_26010 [Candidatus Poribacteria bacterium]|jgi:formylglycine-generating enzyme required for sulfatase activity|nr:hypothetical protein [Candidatus Poribacteria bacterium]HIB87644.1 hypothetical protein [Candidatus Poribacteria bacterium]HIO09960.1 hypothetical protein [Candidatus Poribacteria bacterium]
MRVLSGLLCLPLLVMGQEKIKWQKDGSQMALIPAGSFEMDDTEPDGSQCNFADKNAPEKFGHASRGAGDGYKYTSYPANGYGLYDMAGN